MAVEYVNRRGDRYFLFQGKTRTGKPKYYMARKSAGVPMNAVPEGYEIHESPENAQVMLRRVKPSRILTLEREQLTRWTRELAGTEFVLVDVDRDSLIVYAHNSNPAEQAESLRELLGPFAAGMGMAADDFARRGQYTAMFRFSLQDEDERLFHIERWCFRGGIENWFYLTGGQTLERLAKKYLPHLNRESFFELM